MAWDPPATGRATGYLVPATEWEKIAQSFLDVGRILTQTGTAVDVVNTAAETSVFSYSIPANTLGAHGVVQCVLIGDYLNDSGAARTFDFKTKLGGTTLTQHTSPSISAAATRRALNIEIEMANAGVTNAQHLNGQFFMTGTSATTGIGALASTAVIASGFASAPTNPTLDTTSAQTFDVTVTHSAAHGSLSFRVKHARLFFYPLP